MSTVLECEQQLNIEREIIKELLLSKINNDGLEDVHTERLKNEVEVNNQIVRDYFDRIEEQEDFELWTKGNYFYDLFSKYLYLCEANDEIKNNLDFSIKESQDKYIDYLSSLTRFSFCYGVNKRLLEIIEWYYTTIGDTSHNKETFVNAVANDGVRLFVFRNELLGNEVDLDFDKECLNLPKVRETLKANIKSLLEGDFSYTNVNAAKKDSISGLLLFQLLNISSYISLLKEYGITTEEFNPESELHVYFESEKKYFERIGYIEEASEYSNIFINAAKIAERFDREKQSRY